MGTFPELERVQHECQTVLCKLIAVNQKHQYSFFYTLGLTQADQEIRTATLQALFYKECPLRNRLAPEEELVMYKRFLCELKAALSLAVYLQQFK